MNQNTAILRCCPICSAFCDEEFKQVINLKKSGLSIYLHHNKDSSQQRNVERKRSIILCNSTHKELKRFDYIAELCQYKTKCFKCEALIQHIRSLLENLTTINENEIIAICEYCKRCPKMNKCKRCEYLIVKFLNKEAERYLENKIRYNELISNVRQVLLCLTQSQIICKHNVYIDSESKMHLQKLLKHINWPVNLKQPNIDFLLNILEKQKTENIFTSKISKESYYDTLLKVTSKKRNDSIMDDELSLFETGSSCICKYLIKDKVREQPSHGKTETEDLLFNSLKPKLNETNGSKTSISSRVSPNSAPKSLLPKTSNKLKEHISKKKPGKEKYNNNNKSNVVIKKKKEKDKLSETTKNKSKQFLEPCIDSIVKLVYQAKKVKTNIKNNYRKEKTEELSKILDLAVDELKEHKEILLERSESVLECRGGNSMNVSERIKGTKIVPCSRHVTGHNFEKLPMFFHVQHNLDLRTLSDHKSFSLNSEYNKDQPQAKKSGVFLYKLSDQDFIDKGWTKLPTTKIMRRMNIYKMMPSYTEFDWFENHKDAKILFYDSNKKLAEIYENGCGKWFYENGNLALEYYSAPELYSNKRCIIYGSKRDMALKRKNYVNIMACFDYLGNGIVFDKDGNVRLKYNQCEGLVIDKKIGPPGRWKWHKLNEPPVLYPVLIDTFVKDTLSKKDIEYKEHSTKETDMITNIEMNNLQREQASKMVQKYKSFQIRIKVVKINEYFTLKIINQATIYLQFRYEHVSLKLNLGMWLKNKEIVDVNVAEVSEVSTPFDDLNKKIKKSLFDE